MGEARVFKVRNQLTNLARHIWYYDTMNVGVKLGLTVLGLFRIRKLSYKSMLVRVLSGAVAENRTRDTCLEGRSFTAKLQPRIGIG